MTIPPSRGVRRIVAALGVVAAVALLPSAAGAAPPPGAARLSDQILDPAARGNVTYENTANVASYQQDGLLTHRGYQYTAWYRADRRAVISRRKLPHGTWQSIELDQFLYSDDSHNTIAMGVTRDGRIHIAYPTHANALFYARSVPGVASAPRRARWASTSFERTRTVVPGAAGAPRTLTYPQFEEVGGRMLLTYRDGSSNNGRQVLLRYDDNAAGTWTYLGRFTGSTGTYTSPFGSSTSRYGYLHGFTANPVTGDLEIAFSWREQSSAWCSPSGLGNHDLGYARSPDRGLTWRNDAGAVIGRTGSDDLITVDDPHVVVPIAINRGLINQETQAVDRGGRLHVVTSMFNEADLAKLGGCHTQTYPQRAQYAKPYHHWRGPDGRWRSFELPYYNNSSGRSKLFFDRHDTAYLVLPDARIAAATARHGWRDWRIVFAARDVANVSELILDRQRLRRGVLSVAYQEPSEANAPSAFRIADFRIRPGGGDRPKDTRPQPSPVPYAGSALVYPHAIASSSQPGYPPDAVVDGDAASFWVSGGTAPGQGPTPADPEILTVEYGEPRDIAAVTVTPRVNYGPRAFAIEARVDGTWQRLAEVEQANAAATHAVTPTRADAIRLVITAAYDTQPTPRNVQVAEVAVEGGEG